MNVRALQQQLAESEYLLPSQRDLLSRLLFQLAFNNFTSFGIIGSAGSGKTTIALALAELFSGCQEQQINIAMLHAPLTDEQLLAQLGKQWFSNTTLSEHELKSAILAAADSAEFVLIADNIELLSRNQYELLLALPAKCFMFGCQSDHNLQLNLTIPVLSLADCQQLLHEEALDPLTLAERFANSQNNIHFLLANNTVSIAVKPPSHLSMKSRITPVIIATAVLLLFFFIWMQDSEVNEADLPAVADITAFEPSVIDDTAEMPMAVSSSFAGPDNVIAETDESELRAELSEPVLKTDVNTVMLDEEPTDQSSFAALAVAEATPIVEESLPTQEAIARSNPIPEITVPSKYDHASLLQVPATQSFVQLAVLSDEKALERFKAAYPNMPILVYTRQSNNKMQVVIVSGPFATNNAARKHIQQLPTSLSASGPFIKTAAAVQQEILAWQQLKLAETSQDN